MAIKIPKSAPQVQIEPNTYIARCYSMVHIGTVEYDWMGEKKQANKVRITFELPTETKVFKEEEGPKPLVISGEYSLSLGKKAKFRPLLENWRGKPFTEDEAADFDVSKLVGVPAMISVIVNDKGYAEIGSIVKLPKGTECPPQVNPSQILDYDNWDEEQFKKLPEFIQKKIMSSVEYRRMKGTYVEDMGSPGADTAGVINVEDIPF